MDNQSLVNEMARVGDFNIELEVYVRTDEGGNVPHFHIRDKSSRGKAFHTCVQIRQPAYFHHDGKEGVLDSTQKTALVEFLRSKPTRTKRFSTFWEVILTLWNLSGSAIAVDEDQPMPDYANLADEPNESFFKKQKVPCKKENGVGARLLEILRERKDLSLDDMAKACGVSKATIVHTVKVLMGSGRLRRMGDWEVL